MKKLNIKYVFIGLSGWLWACSPLCAEPVPAHKSWDYQFELHKGGQFSLCRDYIRNFKQYIAQHPETTPYDLACSVKITPQYQKLFALPQWTTLAPREHHDWFLAFFKNISEIFQKPLDMGEFNRFLTEYEVGPGKRDYAMQRASFDFDFNGTRDSVLRIDGGGDCTQPDFNRFKQRNRYRGTFGVSFHPLTENQTSIDPYGSRRWEQGFGALSNNIEYFFYQGRTFYRQWFGSFEHFGSTSDLYHKKAGEPTDAYIEIYEPQPVSSNTRTPHPYIYRVQVCEIKIVFKTREKGDKK